MKALEDMTLEELWHLFPIALQPYQKVWLTWYEQEKSLLTQCLPMEHVVRIAHIGSTSFGSIQAKAIIDILVEIAPWEKRMEIAAILKKLGYLCMSEDASRISFNKGYTPEGFAEKVFHLHLRQRNDHDELYFRDYMKEHEEHAQAYEQLKMKLALAYPYHRDAYTEGKTAFVKHITAIARTAYGNRYETKAYAISLHEQTKDCLLYTSIIEERQYNAFALGELHEFDVSDFTKVDYQPFLTALKRRIEENDKEAGA